MNWNPLIDPGDKRIVEFLTDLEITRIKQLESKFTSTTKRSEQLKFEKEILNIYLMAIERNKKKKWKLGDWLNEVEAGEVNRLRDEIIHSENPFYYEAMIYQVYLESISRQIQFNQESEVRKLINSMKQTTTNEEADGLAKNITELLRGAGS